MLKLKADLLPYFAHQRLFRRLACFDMAANQIPMVGKRNSRLVVTQVDDQSMFAVEKNNLRDLLHCHCHD
jgi:hypothetical protein